MNRLDDLLSELQELGSDISAALDKHQTQHPQGIPRRGDSKGSVGDGAAGGASAAVAAPTSGRAVVVVDPAAAKATLGAKPASILRTRPQPPVATGPIAAPARTTSVPRVAPATTIPVTNAGRPFAGGLHVDEYESRGPTKRAGSVSVESPVPPVPQLPGRAGETAAPLFDSLLADLENTQKLLHSDPAGSPPTRRATAPAPTSPRAVPPDSPAHRKASLAALVTAPDSLTLPHTDFSPLRLDTAMSLLRAQREQSELPTEVLLERQSTVHPYVSAPPSAATEAPAPLQFGIPATHPIPLGIPSPIPSDPPSPVRILAPVQEAPAEPISNERPARRRSRSPSVSVLSEGSSSPSRASSRGSSAHSDDAPLAAIVVAAARAAVSAGAGPPAASLSRRTSASARSSRSSSRHTSQRRSSKTRSSHRRRRSSERRPRRRSDSVNDDSAAAATAAPATLDSLAILEMQRQMLVQQQLQIDQLQQQQQELRQQQLQRAARAASPGAALASGRRDGRSGVDSDRGTPTTPPVVATGGGLINSSVYSGAAGPSATVVRSPSSAASAGPTAAAGRLPGADGVRPARSVRRPQRRLQRAGSLPAATLLDLDDVKNCRVCGCSDFRRPIGRQNPKQCANCFHDHNSEAHYVADVGWHVDYESSTMRPHA